MSEASPPTSPCTLSASSPELAPAAAASPGASVHGAPTHEPRDRRLALVVGLGVLLRLAHLALAGRMDYHADEAGYLELALGWNRFGHLGDNGRFAWPPGYPFLLARALAVFGTDGVIAVKLLQVALSAAVGLATASLARRLFGPRAGLFAAALWAVHLPLSSYTHLLWPETVFLALAAPALALCVAAVQDAAAADGGVDGVRGGFVASATARVLLAGLLLGLAALVKELGVALVAAFALALLGAGRPGLREGARRASLLALAALAVVAPWLARNHAVYGRLTSTGITLGENVFRGLNAIDASFDTSFLVAAEPDALDGTAAASRDSVDAPEPVAAQLARSSSAAERGPDRREADGADADERGLDRRGADGADATERGPDRRRADGDDAEERRGAPAVARRWFVDPRGIEPWPREKGLQNLADLSRAHLARGLAFAAAHPGYVLRTRLKKQADLATPLSFLVRHYALGLYEGALAARPVRAALVGLSVAQSLLVLALAAIGLALLLTRGGRRRRAEEPVGLVEPDGCGRGGRGQAEPGSVVPRRRAGSVPGSGPGSGVAVGGCKGTALVLAVLATVGASALLLSASRFRVPAEPVLLALAGGALARLVERRPPRGLALVLALAGLALLALAWWIDLPEIRAVLEAALA